MNGLANTACQGPSYLRYGSVRTTARRRRRCRGRSPTHQTELPGLSVAASAASAVVSEDVGSHGRALSGSNQVADGVTFSSIDNAGCRRSRTKAMPVPAGELRSASTLHDDVAP